MDKVTVTTSASRAAQAAGLGNVPEFAREGNTRFTRTVSFVVLLRALVRQAV